jgi:hypothetical protein
MKSAIDSESHYTKHTTRRTMTSFIEVVDNVPISWQIHFEKLQEINPAMHIKEKIQQREKTKPRDRREEVKRKKSAISKRTKGTTCKSKRGKKYVSTSESESWDSS